MLVGAVHLTEGAGAGQTATLKLIVGTSPCEAPGSQGSFMVSEVTCCRQ